ncbi:hypothetical protein HXX76_000699 [Chlamydomonas incerta]|uniref:Tubulin-specific chaperone D n=1 Tax=Chlamydomonas incerta TaxID=51695 RepID=A0A835WEL1_CHLIN|nr:hypothetical protein HXX76_000699 [Chlamydomonas incerta]|eukprot:KAG2446099.1 hypothetical protein HXX76_000699 [Chlamydomonas incerta]
MEPEQSDDEQDRGEEQSFFEEAPELDSLVKRVVDSDGLEAQQVYERYKAILYKYQEQSQLLDAYLEGIVVPLAGLLRKQAVLQQEQGLQRVLNTCRLLNVLVVVRGYKTVVRFFPHEAADLERVVDILEVVKAQQPKDSEEGIALWEAQTMLLLWLSILILIPFDLATVDSSATGARDGSLPYTALVGRILGLCQDYLHHPGGVREMSAVVLGRLLTRPDMGGALAEFLDWVPAALGRVEPLRAPFLLPGVMQALCCVFKMGQRDRLLPFASRAWALSARLAAGTAGDRAAAEVLAGNVLARKLSVKLVTRIGLTFLQPRAAAPWRYVRGGASLDVTLGATASATAAAAAAAAAGEDGDGGEEEEIEIAEEVEEVVEALLGALRDRDTVVRWSGAKGLGQLTGCLPRELGDEVLESVMQLFGPTESDTAWHGGCLALAELARRGLLLPPRLPPLMPVVRAALHYDVRRGPHSIGAHVRDAAAYVCWAFARAYAPELLEGSVTLLASSLLTIACYDREVNCRRAAAAAFQEAVGRLGNFPHGIPLLTIADYFSVGIAQQAYLKVAPQVAALGPEYRTPLAAHLVTVKARHWEKSLRELAARAAAALAPAGPGPYLAGEGGLDVLLPACLNEQLEVRHGAVVMVAELLPALKAAAAADPASNAACWPLSPERASEVASLVPAIDKARLYRGKGGEIMREAVSRLIECCADVQLAMSPQQHAKVLEALDENLRHPQQYIQSGAVAAVRAYARAYLSHDARAAAAFRTKYQDGYLSRLHDPNVAVRRGYSLALGSLPRELLEPVLEEAVEALVDGCVPEEDPDERDVDSRVNCTRGLGLLIATMYGVSSSSGSGGGDADGEAGPSMTAGAAPMDVEPDQPRQQQPDPEAKELLRDKVLPSLQSGLEDYTTDNRGDVGSWVREAAMAVLEPAVRALAAAADDQSREAGAMLSDVAGRAVGLLLRQSVERIGRLREAALRHVRRLLADPLVRPHVPHAAAVAAAVAAASEAAAAGGVSASLEALQRVVVQLLPVAPYTGYLLEGLAASIGGVDNSLAKVASAALLEALACASGAGSVGDGAGAGIAAAADGGAGAGASGSGSGNGLTTAVALAALVSGHFLDIWARHAKSSRMATPLLRTALLLLTKAPGAADALLPRPPPMQAAAAAASSAAGGEADSVSTAPAPAAASSSARGVEGPQSVAESQSRWVDHLVEAARAETRGCGDVARLLEAAALLAHLAVVPPPRAGAAGGACGHYRSSALQGLMVLLCSRYPKVRRHAAEQLYMQLLAMDTASALDSAAAPATSSAATPPPPPLESVSDAACELLLATAWDGDMEAAKAARDALAALVGVAVPKMKAPAASAKAAAASRDENASYQALLDDFARGY